jgi:predicted deacetylase
MVKIKTYFLLGGRNQMIAPCNIGISISENKYESYDNTQLQKAEKVMPRGQLQRLIHEVKMYGLRFIATCNWFQLLRLKVETFFNY